MKLLYNPAYTGFVYTDPSRLMFDEKLVDTGALLEEIKLRSGLCSCVKSEMERVIDYYKAMAAFMDKTPDNIFAKSFELDGLSTAKRCLSWRDSLAFAGWTKGTPAPSKRMQTLCDIEEFFDDNSHGQEIIEITRAINNGCLLDRTFEIICMVRRVLLSPIEQSLLTALENSGIKITEEVPDIKITFDTIPDDSSLEVLKFEERDEALRYLSQIKPDEYDVWINSDNKLFDNWLKLQGQPVCGSYIQGGIPQLTQTLMIGIKIFERPLNLTNLIEWLNVPLSPLHGWFRHRLSDVIAEKCGYYNKECKTAIDHFINEDPDKKEMEKRQALVQTYLPNINEEVNTSDLVNLGNLKQFVSSLQDWCSQKLAILKDDIQKTQLAFVNNQCEGLLLLLDQEKKPQIEYSRLENLAAVLNSSVTISQYQAQAGCRNVINAPGQIYGNVQKTIWCDFYNAPAPTLMYSFLTPAEKNEFSKTLALWPEENERELYKTLSLTPFARTTKKLTLVVINKIGSGLVQKHPILIRMEQQKDEIKKIIKYPQLDKALYKKPKPVNNGMDKTQEFVRLTKANHIQWPQKESPTSFTNIVYNPFDYTFGNLAGIGSKGVASIPEFWIVRGNVAHAVIEAIFNHYDDIPQSGTVPYIQKVIQNDFDKVFEQTIRAYGATYLLKENSFEKSIYKDDVRNCVNNLLEVLKDNNLTVVSCEQYLQNENMNFPYNITISGSSDMILKDPQNQLVIFDFKWSGNEKKYTKILEENRSIQLVLYKELAAKAQEKSAKSSAYVLLPKCTIISTDNFTGDCKQITPIEDRDNNLLEELRRSYAYRRQQISDGLVEEGENLTADQITYQKDADSKGLIPLEFDEETEIKIANKYSNYTCFKVKK